MSRKTTLTISDSIEIVSPVEFKIVRVVSLSTTEITEVTLFGKKYLQRPDTLMWNQPNVPIATWDRISYCLINKDLC